MWRCWRPGPIGDYYSRKIVLHRQSDGRPVLFGIPRLNLRLVDDDVREEILSERIRSAAC